MGVCLAVGQSFWLDVHACIVSVWLAYLPDCMWLPVSFCVRSSIGMTDCLTCFHFYSAWQPQLLRLILQHSMSEFVVINDFYASSCCEGPEQLLTQLAAKAAVFWDGTQVLSCLYWVQKYKVRVYLRTLVSTNTSKLAPDMCTVFNKSFGAKKIFYSDHKLRIYKEYRSACPLVGIGTLPTPLPPASVPLPRNQRRGAH
jgi:hypothetical protein